MTKKELENLLKATVSPNSLEGWLIQIVCNQEETQNYKTEDQLLDIFTNGCDNGIISDLLDVEICLELYNQFETEIWELIDDLISKTSKNIPDFLQDIAITIEAEAILRLTLVWVVVDKITEKLIFRFLPY